MAATATWAPERRDVIWIDCNPQVGKEMRLAHLQTHEALASDPAARFKIAHEIDEAKARIRELEAKP